MAVSSYLLGDRADDETADRNLTEDETLSRTVERVNDWFSYFNQNIENARDDIYFAVINQWDQDLYSERVQQGKACLQINFIYSIIASLVGQYRKQTPEFKVFTITNETNPQVKVDQDMIDIYDGLMRQIFFDNNSSIIFQQVGESALLRGYGAIVINVEYESDFSFNQVPKFRCIDDPLMCFFDPTAKESTKADGRYCGEVITYSLQEFRDKFPQSKYAEEGALPTSFPITQVDREFESFWRAEEWIRVANCFVKQAYPIEIAQLSDGRSMLLAEAKKEVEEHQLLMETVKRKENDLKKKLAKRGHVINDKSFLDNHEPLEIVDKRDSIDYKIINYVMTQDEILEEAVWPSKIMPVIFVDGHSQYIDGKQYTKSFHRTAKDAQKVVNYTASEAIENLMNSHKSQWIGTPENFAGYENVWRNPSLATGALVANRDASGNLPEQQQPPTISPNFLQMFQQSAQDIKATLGYYEANTGEQGKEISGVAIANRAKQGAMASFVYFDNWGRAIEQTAKCIMSLIPALYDNSRNIMIRTEKGEQKSVAINKPNGQDYDNDMTNGNYGIEVSVGSNYEIQKQENLDALKDLMATLAPTNPELVGALADLYAANTDLENTTQIVDRIRDLMLGKSPQDILREEMDLPPSPPKPNPQAAMMQAEQQAKMAELQLKAQEIKLEHDSRMAELNYKTQELQLKMIQAKNEADKIAMMAQDNRVEIYKADKSLEEIKTSTAAERYNSDSDERVAKIEALSAAHTAAMQAHEKSIELHKMEYESKSDKE